MPTYEYACTSCEQHLEVSQSFSDEPLTTCPHCGGDLRKVFGSIGIVLKGSGFYRTDSRTSAAKTASNDGKDGASKDGAASRDGAASTGKTEKTENKDSGAAATAGPPALSSGAPAPAKPSSASAVAAG